MAPKKIIWIIIFLVAKTAIGQEFKPNLDSCVVTVSFMSIEKIPYPGRSIVFIPENNKQPSAEITDSLGKAEFLLPKASSFSIMAYNGSLLIGNYNFSTPNKPGLMILNYEIQEDFFNEDRTNEILIDTTWANDRKLIPSANMIEVEVKLKNEEGNPLPQTMVLFRDSTSKNVFIGETNDNGEFNILLPKDQQYGVRITRLGNRIPICDLSTKFEATITSLKLDLKYSLIEEKNYSEFSHTTFKSSKKQMFSDGNIPDLFTLKNLYFDFDKSIIQPASYPELDILVSVLKRFPKIHIEIRGHTDDFGEDEYNLQLSGRRSATVRNYLIENGISSSRIQSNGYGEKLPVESNETASGRQDNRRTEVKVISR
jgi:outer membrane protein OmpA-like peptidoglycan-associated protein